jgi:hypothetical protein
MTTSHVRSFKELRVYPRAWEVPRAVFRFSKTFPKDEIGRMLNSMIGKSESCGGPFASTLHESGAEYFTSTAAPATDD